MEIAAGEPWDYGGDGDGGRRLGGAVSRGRTIWSPEYIDCVASSTSQSGSRAGGSWGRLVHVSK